jgi:signal transduction histidine kinase
MINLKVIFEMAMDQTLPEQGRLREILTIGGTHADEAIERARMALRELRKPLTEIENWKKLVIRLTKSFADLTGTRVEINFGNSGSSYPENLEDFIILFVQECLTNSYRHGQASSVTISFWVRDRELILWALDNGKGSSTITPGIGVSGMHERLTALGGSLNFTSLAKGLLVEATIPLPETGNAAH